MIDANVDGRPMPSSFQPLDEARLGVPRRRAGLVALASSSASPTAWPSLSGGQLRLAGGVVGVPLLVAASS